MSKIPNVNDGKVYNDKVYYECNLKMQDGRGLTDYRSNCMINNEMIYNNNIVNTYNYRNFLQNNANNLRKQIFLNKTCYFFKILKPNLYISFFDNEYFSAMKAEASLRPDLPNSEVS